MSEYPEEKALETWQVDGLTCSIVRQRSGHLCGYVRFPNRPLRENGYDGILTYVPVHGGITYAAQDDDGSMVYGFDCSHSGDAPPIEHESEIGLRYRDPTAHVWTEDEVRPETERMARGIALAAKYEERYLLAAENEEKASTIDEFTAELGVPLDVSDNFGVMINVLGGKL